MAIVSFSKNKLIDYVPEYAGNRDSADPCIVQIKYVPFSKVQDYGRIITTRAKGVNDPIKLKEIYQEIQKRQFCENVEGVINYLVDDREVKDAETFYETADTELIIEIIKAMESMSKLSEGQRKNS